VGQSIWQVPLPANNLTLGGYYRHEDMTDLTSNGLAGSTRTGATRTSWALFAENELSILKSLRLTGGIRMDNDEQYGVHWTPRAYLVWSVTGRVTLKGGYSQGFRAPSLRQTLVDWGQTSRGGTIYGNPDLEAETSRTFEASALYEGGESRPACRSMTPVSTTRSPASPASHPGPGASMNRSARSGVRPRRMSMSTKRAFAASNSPSTYR
jgi:outer membrane receptor for ferrienterochelin and colicins